MMLWYRQGTSQRRQSSSAECRIRSWVWDTKSPADWMPTHKPTELSRIEQKLELNSPSYASLNETMHYGSGELLHYGSLHGHRWMWQKLRDRGVIAKQEIVRVIFVSPCCYVASPEVPTFPRTRWGSCKECWEELDYWRKHNEAKNVTFVGLSKRAVHTEVSGRKFSMNFKMEVKMIHVVVSFGFLFHQHFTSLFHLKEQYGSL